MNPAADMLSGKILAWVRQHHRWPNSNRWPNLLYYGVILSSYLLYPFELAPLTSWKWIKHCLFAIFHCSYENMIITTHQLLDAAWNMSSSAYGELRHANKKYINFSYLIRTAAAQHICISNIGRRHLTCVVVLKKNVFPSIWTALANKFIYMRMRHARLSLFSLFSLRLSIERMFYVCTLYTN